MPTIYPLVRRGLFMLPTEAAHELALGALERLPPAGHTVLRSRYGVDDMRLRTTAFGIEFPNPVGLAAGFDKAGRAFEGLSAMGFGFVEIGTVTALKQPGNPRPRLFRLPADGALLNRMGFNNPGSEEVRDHLARRTTSVILGINLGKSKVTPLERAAEDYLASIERLERFASYIVVNVSSPNTPGLRELQDAAPLRALLKALATRDAPGVRRPLLLKLAPDLTDAQMDEAVDIAIEGGIAGIIAVNTTISRSGLRTPEAELAKLGAGGISGRPLKLRAQEVVSRIYSRTDGRIPIIGVGGIFDAADAWERIRAGASLIQLYTGFIYSGPALVRRINLGLLERMERTGAKTLTEVVGSGLR